MHAHHQVIPRLQSSIPIQAPLRLGLALLTSLLFALLLHAQGAQLERVCFTEHVPFGTAVDYQGNAVVVGSELLDKFGPDANHLWSISMGEDRIARSVAVDHQGNILVGSEAWPHGWEEGIVTKTSPSGTLLWTVSVGGTNYQGARALAVDPHNNILVTGFRSPLSGEDKSQYGYVAKLTPNGSPLWVTHFGGSGGDYGTSMTSDSVGNVIVAGLAVSSNWVSGGYNVSLSFSGAGHASVDGFVLKMDPNGNHLWSTYVGGTDFDYAHGVATDNYDNVLVTGETTSPNWVSGGYRTNYGVFPPDGAWGGFLVKLSANGTHLWSTYLGPTEGGESLAVDWYGNIFVTGPAGDPWWDTDWARLGFDPVFSGSGDAYVEKFTPDGTQAWASYLGGSAHDEGMGIAAAPDGSVWVAGYAGSTNVVEGTTNAVGGFLARITEGVYFRGVGNWSNTNLWTLPPMSNTTILLPYRSILYVNVPGAQGGILRLDAGSAMTVQPTANLALYGPVVNNGAMTLSGPMTSHTVGDSAFIQSGTLTIDRTGSFNANSSGFYQSAGTANVDGTLAVGLSAGSGGVGMNVAGGTFNIGSGGTVIAGTANGGGYGFTQSGGSTLVNGTLAFGAGGGTGSVGLYGGTLAGSGLIAGSLAANGGVLSPGSSPGTLTVSNDFVLNTGATLLIELAGRGANQLDQLEIGGTAQLGGTLVVQLLGGFAPVIGEQFPILSSSSLSGAFAKLNVPQGISVNCSGSGVFLVVTGTVPAQIVGPALISGNFVFRFGTVNNQSYTIERTDNLATANWVFQTTLIGNGGLMQFLTPLAEAPRGFFRVRQP